MELPSTDIGKTGEDFHFGHAKFEMSIRHLSGENKVLDLAIWNLGSMMFEVKI
jgi:hypothetical protein